MVINLSRKSVLTSIRNFKPGTWSLELNAPKLPNPKYFSLRKAIPFKRKFHKGIHIYQVGEIARAVSHHRCGQPSSFFIRAQFHLEEILELRSEIEIFIEHCILFFFLNAP